MATHGLPTGQSIKNLLVYNEGIRKKTQFEMFVDLSKDHE